MTEDVYANISADLTKKARYGRGERQMEMEERGESIDDIYLTPNNQDPIYATADDQDSIYVTDKLDPAGKQQDAAPKNTAQDQLGGKIIIIIITYQKVNN